MGEKRLGRRALVLVLGAIALTAASGCGGDDGDDGRATAAGDRTVTHVRADRYAYARGLFNEMCSGCHTLDDAGAEGKRYDLDKSPGLNAAQVWNAIQNGEPGMPAFGEPLSERELAALAVYVTNVAGREEGDERWGTQIRRRTAGEAKAWKRFGDALERQLEREGRAAENTPGEVTAPEEGAGG